MSVLESRISQDFVSIPSHVSVKEAGDLVRQKKAELGDKFAYVYIVGSKGELEGALPLRDLLLGDPSARVSNLLNERPIFLYSDSSNDVIKSLFTQYPFLALPVVDHSQKLIGILPAEKVTDIVKIKPKRSLHYFGSGGEEEIEGQSVFKILGRRLPWLLLSIICGLMCAYILGIFIEEIENIIALVLFIPIVLGIAGGVGVQSSVITIRGLSEGKLKLSLLGRVLAKEFAIGLLMGVISCLVIMGIALLWQKTLVLGLALGVSVVACVFVSSLTGIALPLILRTLRMSPALASGLFVLIICDILVMMVYFTLSFAIINPSL